MDPLDDYPIGLQQDNAPEAIARDTGWQVWTVLGVAAMVVAAAVAFYFLRPSRHLASSAGSPPVAPENSTASVREPLGGEPEPRELPPLELMDPVVRELLGGLSSRPELAAWLATDGLVRSFVASVDAVANGATPAAHLRRLAPSRPFAVEPRGDAFVVDGRSYRRFDGIADTVDGLDAKGLARAYATLRPRLQEAYRELGYPDADFDHAVERAIGLLLDTPLPERDVRVQPAPVLYQYADPRLERLAPAQKQLLRMGPRNQRIIQNKLRDVALALGIPS